LLDLRLIRPRELLWFMFNVLLLLVGHKKRRKHVSKNS
jgi:hypothetical protein